MEIGIEGLETFQLARLGQALTQVGARLFAKLVEPLGRRVFNADGGEGLNQRQVLKFIGQGIHGLVVAAVGLEQAHGLLAMHRRQNGAQGSLGLLSSQPSRRGHANHEPLSPAHQFRHLLGIGGSHVHHFDGHAGLCNAPGEGLGNAIAKPVVRHVEHRYQILGLGLLLTPTLVTPSELYHVVAQQRAVARGYHGHRRQRLHALHGPQHRPGVGSHQALVVKAKIGGNNL